VEERGQGRGENQLLDKMRHVRHKLDRKGIEIPVRELHARTGHYVRKAARQRIVITDRGKRVAELYPFGSATATSWPGQSTMACGVVICCPGTSAESEVRLVQ